MTDITIRDLDPYNIGALAYLAEVMPFDEDDTKQRQSLSMSNRHMEALNILLLSFCIALQCDDVSNLVDSRKELLALLENCQSKIGKMLQLE